jgi:hypothetical protein
MPISACADQWQWGKLSSLWAQTLNRNCGPNAIKRPSAITTAAKIIYFFSCLLR